MSKMEEASASVATVEMVLSSSSLPELDAWLSNSGLLLEDADNSALREGTTRKFMESERAIPPRIVESDEGDPPLKLEGGAQLTLDTGVVGAKEILSGPVGTGADDLGGAAADNPEWA